MRESGGAEIILEKKKKPYECVQINRRGGGSAKAPGVVRK